MITAIQIELDLLCLVMLYAIAHQSLANVNQQMNRVLFRTLVYGVMIQLALDILQEQGIDAYVIGQIIAGEEKVILE